MPSLERESPHQDCVYVRQKGEDGNYFPAGSIFTSPGLEKGITTVFIPKGISLTITTANYVDGCADTATLRVTTAAGSFPLCFVPLGGTISGLGLTLAGPQEIKLDVTEACEAYVLGSVSPATYKYKMPLSKKESPDSHEVSAEEQTKKRKLSNGDLSNETPLIFNEDFPVKEQVTLQNDFSQDSQNEGDKIPLSKRQRKKLAKKKAKELADAVAILNKHESKVESSDVNKCETKKTVPLTKERRLPSGVVVKDIIVGTGAPVKLGRKVSILYEGAFPSGQVFDKNKNRNNPLTFRQATGEVIKGLEKGIEGMKVGGEREITIPPEQGYGKKGSGNVVPPNSTLVFSVQLVAIGS